MNRKTADHWAGLEVSDDDMSHTAINMLESMFSIDDDPEHVIFIMKEAVEAGAAPVEMLANTAVWLMNRGGKRDQEACAAGRRLLRELETEVPSAKFNLAVEILKRPARPHQLTHALRMVTEVAQASVETRLRASALAVMGQMHASGLGCRANLQTGAKYYAQAAELGNDVAAYNLGLFYHGKTAGWPEINMDKAAYFYELAVAKGNLEAQTNLGCLHYLQVIQNADRKYGHDLLRRSAADGDLVAVETLSLFSSAGI